MVFSIAMRAAAPTLGSRRSAAEAAWFGLAMLALLASFVLEHFFVHRLIILPALEVGTPPLWMWGSMFVPELVVSFAIGWRLRSWAPIIGYAVAAAVLRETFQLVLAAAGEPGHAPDGSLQFTEFALNAPAVALIYVVVLRLGSWSGSEEPLLRQ
jgi:hypothetical protein